MKQQGTVFFHGSPHKLKTLRKGSWVTPYEEDALSFAAPWGSKDLNAYNKDKEGRPPKQLDFKDRPPKDHPIYVYKVKGPTKPALTNTGRDYDWNRQITEDTDVELVKTMPSWHKALLSKTGSRVKRPGEYEHYTPSTGDDGRVRRRTNDNPTDQVRSAFSESDRHLFADTGWSSSETPVGSYQSKTAAPHRLHYRTKFRDLDISIENRAGTYRHWYDKAADRAGKTLQKYPYGYIRMTKGMDGDHVDCYLGPNTKALNVYVITTNKPPEFKVADEQKCMLGFDSAKEARQAFLDHFDNPKFLRELRTIPYEEFRDKVLLTLKSRRKKLASNLQLEDVGKLSRGPGSYDGQTPGDRLGLPYTKTPRMRKNMSEDMEPKDTIDRSFRFMDEPMNTRVLEGTGGLPESPGV